MGIDIRIADITTLKVDAIVNAANESLLGGGGVDGMIHLKARKELLLECKKLGGCKTGEAKITKGYKLPAKNVIHTVGPIYRKGQDNEKLLKSCYVNSLELAKLNNIRSIAFPSISTGAYGYPKEEAVQVAVSAVVEWLENNKLYDIEVIFCCYDRSTYELYIKEVGLC